MIWRRAQITGVQADSVAKSTRVESLQQVITSGEAMTQRPAAVLAVVAGLALTACGGGSGSVDTSGTSTNAAEVQQAFVRMLNGLEDCYAPRDIGTSLYPTDQPSKDCTRQKIQSVVEEAPGVWCVQYVWQSTWKFSDTDGFGDTGIKVSKVCYTVARDSLLGDGDPSTLDLTNRVSDTELGQLADWPS